MKILTKKISIGSIFIFFIVLNLFIGSFVQAKDDNTKVNINSKYNPKKVNRIKNSIKQKNNYRFLISSNETLDSIKNFFIAQDKKFKIKQYGENTYMVRFSKNSSFLTDIIIDIDNGILPTSIGGYNVIQPEIVESLGNLDGEEITLLWGNTRIGADLFQEELSLKEKIKVGILDTGIDNNHIDLENNYNSILSYDFVNEDTDAIDDNGHGTQVAGIIGAEVNGTGRYGVNSNSDLVSLKVLDLNGIGTTYDILEAIEYAKLNGIKVLNMSFGGVGTLENNPVCDAITDAKLNGIITITSAGNSNSEITNTIPASCPDTITVGGIDGNNEKTTFSNYGTGVTLYAPGTNIYTTDLNSNYKTVEGTSYSSAFVSGLVAKELAFSGTLNQEQVITNLENNYNLLSSYTSVTQTTNNIDGFSQNTFERFSDLRFLSIDTGFVYYADLKNLDKIYKILITPDLLPFLSDYYSLNSEIVFSNKSNFNPALFNSGVYIDISEYNNPELIESFSGELLEDTFSISATTFQSLGKNEINYKFNQISGEKVLDMPGYFSYEDDSYYYYRNMNDNYKLYRLKKDGTDINLEGTKIIDVEYAYPYIVDNEYIYYQNKNDNNKFYRIKKDGSETLTGGTKIIDINHSRSNYEDGIYIYYQNSNDNYKIYRIKKDGSEVLAGGTKVVDIDHSYPTFYEGGYIYYQNRNDSYKLYRIAQDGSEVTTGGTKISDSSRFQYLLSELDYIYYLDRDSIAGGIYKIKKDGTESASFGTKILNAPEGGLHIMGYVFHDLDYIYYTDMINQDKIYRVKKDGTDINIGGTLLSSGIYSSILTLDGDYVYYSSRDSNTRATYRVKKDGTESSTLGTKITDLNGSFNNIDDIYLYYLTYVSNEGYKLYKAKKDGTDTSLFLHKDPYRSIGINLDLGVREILINVDSIIPTGTDYKFYLSNDNLNFVEVSKNLLNGVSKIDLNNVLGTYYNETIYYKIELIGDSNNTTATPVINYIEVSLGNEEPLLVSDLEIYGSYGCDSTRVIAYMDLYMTDANGQEKKVYTTSYRHPYISTMGCYRGGWLWGSRYTEHTCYLQDITETDENYNVNYECKVYERRGYSAAGGSGRTRTRYWNGTFAINKSQYDLCVYDQTFCTSGYSGILPGETIIDFLNRINAGIVSKPITTPETHGDPVNLHSGEFTYDNIVMQHNSKGFPFEFEVNYKNKTVYDGILGYNFDYSYNKYLEEQSDGNVYYNNGKLGVFEFINNGTGFDYNTTLKAQLSLIDGKYNLVFNNSKTYVFNVDLKLESKSDNFGNTMSFIYDIDGNLITITDTNGRIYNLIYNINGKLESLTDFNSDKVEFVYYQTGETDGSENDLKTIRITNGTSVKDINFTYTIGTDDITSHNIIKLIDSENNTYVENIYDTEDRVLSQMYGTGSINYTYTTDIDGKITENSVIDREGNNVIYTYDTNGNTIQKIVKKLSGDSIYNYEYNLDNYITKEILPLGNGYTYSYDVNHNLTEKRFKTDVSALDSSDDIVTSYTYDLSFNKPTQIISPNGATINFTLDINGNIISKETLGVNDIDGISQTILESYEYSLLGELISKTDANGNIMSFEYSSGSLVKSIKGTGLDLIETIYNYDNNGNVVSITDGEGNITNLSYDDFNMLQSLTTPEGITSEYTYNKLNKKVNESIILGDLSKVNSSYEYDILDNPTQIISDIDSTRQKITVSSYDKNSNITEITDGNNATVQFSYNEEGYIISKVIVNGAQNITTSYVYDENNRLIKQINPNNSEITFEYDAFDRIIKQILSNGVYTTLSYDKVGNILETKTYSSTGELLQKESNTYDLLGRNTINTKYVLEDNSTITNKSYYDVVGNIVKIIDNNLGEINYSYDSFNNLSQVVDKLGNTIINTYNKNDKLISRTITGTDGKAITTSYAYDSDNRLISETNNLNQTTSYSYNNLNQIISKTDKDGIVTNYKYDYIGNLLEETIDTKTTKYEYDINGNRVKIIDANNNISLYEYDSLNRLIKQTYPDGNIITWEYDISGNLIKRTDPNGTTIINSYDELNRITSRDIQTGTGVIGATSETYIYDELGRVISATDNLGNDLDFSYDSLGRLITETSPHPNPLPIGEGMATVNYSYDNIGNITSINNTNYSYDITNRLLSVKNGTENIANYTYDSLTQLSQTLGNGVTTNYTYDDLLRLSSLGNYNYTYNTTGNITSDGIDTYSYDNLSRIIGVNYDEVNIPQYNGDKIERFFYDNIGNRTSQENYTLKDIKSETCTDETVVEDITLPNGKTKTVERKVRNCETAVTQVEKEKNTLTYETNSLNQYIKLQNLNKNDEVKKEFTYEYDNNGNLTKDDINGYFYDYKNRLIKVIQNEVIKVDENGNIIETIPEETIVEFTYDILGRRIEKKTQDKTINYIYAGQNAIKEIITDNTTNQILETRENIYSNNLDDILSTIITDYTKEIPESKEYFYEKNHLGSITKITDTNGAIVEQYEYDVFGVAYASVNNVEAVTTAGNKKTLSIKKGKGSETDNDGNTDELTIDNIRYKRYNGKGKIGNTRLYTGREYDAELKLYYNRARYYSPDLGRFISRDPIDVGDDINLYAYVGNNGVMYSDVMGMSKALIFWGEDYLSHEYGRNDGNDAFRKKAEVYKLYLINQKGLKPENIHVIDGTTFNNWQNALNNYSNISNITYYGHSNEAGLYLRDATPNDLTDNNTAGLETIYTKNLSINLLSSYDDGTRDHSLSELNIENAIGANIELFGCNTSDIAEVFAKNVKGTSIGSDNNINYEAPIGGDVEFLPVIKPVNFFFFGVVRGAGNGKTLNWDSYDFTN